MPCARDVDSDEVFFLCNTDETPVNLIHAFIHRRADK